MYVGMCVCHQLYLVRMSYNNSPQMISLALSLFLSPSCFLLSLACSLFLFLSLFCSHSLSLALSFFLSFSLALSLSCSLSFFLSLALSFSLSCSLLLLLYFSYAQSLLSSSLVVEVEVEKEEMPCLQTFIKEQGSRKSHRSMIEVAHLLTVRTPSTV